jgi:hypothetical protein
MAAPQSLIDAFLAGDTSSAAALLSDDAAFHSPVRDYHGSERIADVWRAVEDVLAGARTTRVHADGDEVAAFFAGSIKDEPVDGVLRAVGDGHGRVSDVTLMIRPLAALRAGIADVRV